MSKEDENLVLVEFGGLEWRVDPTQHWKHLREDEFSEQLKIVCECIHWLIVLRDIDLPEDRKKDFLERFDTPEAQEERWKAIHGLVWINFRREREFLEDALLIDRLREIHKEDSRHGSKTESNLAEIGARIIDIIKEGDHRAFERMAAIIKNGGPQPTDATKGGIYSDAGTVFSAFCRLHIESGELPTKKEVRHAAVLGDSDEDIEKTRRALLKLGLSGLPEAR